MKDLKTAEGKTFKPKIVNNGDVWGKGENWFTFYCGNCGVQLSNRTKHCENCKCTIRWD